MREVNVYQESKEEGNDAYLNGDVNGTSKETGDLLKKINNEWRLAKPVGKLTCLVTRVENLLPARSNWRDEMTKAGLLEERKCCKGNKIG